MAGWLRSTVIRVMSEGERGSLVSTMERMCQIHVFFFLSSTPSTHFSSRKLKNRVAAQTARDRKKAKMGELEQQVLELEQEVLQCSGCVLERV